METINVLKKESKVEKLNLAFVGLGWIGRNRMERLLENPKVKCSAIVEPITINAENALALGKDIQLCNSIEAVIADESIDGVVIATPSAMHAAQATMALRAGKSVFCQKPLGLNLAEVQEVLNASAEMDKLLNVDFSYRYTKAFAAVNKVVKSGELGKIYAVDLVFHNVYGPDKEWFYDIEKSGGGCLLDLGIHMLDMALWSLDYPKIKKIEKHLYKRGRKLEENKKTVEDYATVMLVTEDETIINLQCSWHSPGGCEAIIAAKFYGTEGGAAFKNINGSFYDFNAEKYNCTNTEILVSPPDEWGGRAGLVWADSLLDGAGYDSVTAQEYLQLAALLDRIYGR